MDCPEAQTLLSPFHDAELPGEMAKNVAQHISNCEKCRDRLGAIQKLSRLARTLTDPIGPDGWAELQARRAEQDDLLPIQSHVPFINRNQRWLVATVALLLLATGLFWNVSSKHHSHDLTESFAPFLRTFMESPEIADSVLAERFHGRLVALDEAERFLKYRPTIAGGIPSGYTLRSAYVINMPCCKCFQANLERKDGSKLVAFEHDGDEPDWFGERPTSTATFQGLPIRITEFNRFVAASCKNGERYLTLVGARSSAEVDELLGYWTSTNNG